jgi:hypothetical protein
MWKTDRHDEANIALRSFAKASKMFRLFYKLEEKRLIFTAVDFVFEKNIHAFLSLKINLSHWSYNGS